MVQSVTTAPAAVHIAPEHEDWILWLAVAPALLLLNFEPSCHLPVPMWMPYRRSHLSIRKRSAPRPAARSAPVCGLDRPPVGPPRTQRTSWPHGTVRAKTESVRWPALGSRARVGTVWDRARSMLLRQPCRAWPHRLGTRIRHHHRRTPRGQQSHRSRVPRCKRQQRRQFRRRRVS